MVLYSVSCFIQVVAIYMRLFFLLIRSEYGRSVKRRKRTLSKHKKNSFTAIQLYEIIKSFKIPRLQHGFYTGTYYTHIHLLMLEAFFSHYQHNFSLSFCGKGEGSRCYLLQSEDRKIHSTST